LGATGVHQGSFWGQPGVTNDHFAGHWGSPRIICGATGDRQESFWGQLGFITDHSITFEFGVNGIAGGQSLKNKFYVFRRSYEMPKVPSLLEFWRDTFLKRSVKLRLRICSPSCF
jgi:hypothetical protein